MSAEQKRFSRRQFLFENLPHIFVAGTALVVSSRLLATLTDETNSPPSGKEVENLGTKKVTIEPGEEINVKEFKEKTQELFESLSHNPKSKKINYGPIGLAYKVEVPSGERITELTITKGLMATKLRGFNPPKEGAFILLIQDNAGYLEIISFSEADPPTRFFPTVVTDIKADIVKPVKMAPSEMAEFLRKAAYIANTA